MKSVAIGWTMRIEDREWRALAGKVKSLLSSVETCQQESPGFIVGEL